jgi:hypothetical protein
MDNLLAFIWLDIFDSTLRAPIIAAATPNISPLSSVIGAPIVVDELPLTHNLILPATFLHPGFHDLIHAMPALADASTSTPSYFLLSVSTRENLELCIKYGLAGFPGGESGAWTFCEVGEGDLVSFLYGARVHNLYRVIKKEAIRDAHLLPPWKPLVFRETGRTYYFPFRLRLEPIRVFSESLVRAEFAYVAENLLLRGGYSKTHFQADQTTLQSASQLGRPAQGTAVPLDYGEYATFEPRFTTGKASGGAPEILRFKETILQSAIKRYLLFGNNLQELFGQIGFHDIPARELEVLGEKALPQGHIDILLKRRTPLGSDPKIPIEVKTQKALPKDLHQLCGYMDELAGECPVGLLVAKDFHKQIVSESKNRTIALVHYSLSDDLKEPTVFEALRESLRFAAFQR